MEIQPIFIEPTPPPLGEPLPVKRPLEPTGIEFPQFVPRPKEPPKYEDVPPPPILLQTEPPPLPPPSPFEQQLRQYFADPRNWQKLLTFARMMPERFERMMGLIREFAPRALREGEQLAEQQHLQRFELQRKLAHDVWTTQRLLKSEEYTHELEKVREYANMLSQTAANATSIDDLFRVKQNAVQHLPEPYFSAVNAVIQTQLLKILQTLPSDQADMTLTRLERVGFVSPREAEQIRGLLRGEVEHRKAFAQTLRMRMANLKRLVERMRVLGEDVSDLEMQLSNLEGVINRMEQFPVTAEYYSNTVRVLGDMERGLSTAVNRTVERIVKALQPIIQVSLTILRPDTIRRSLETLNLREISAILGKVAPETVAGLTRIRGRIAEATNDEIILFISSLADGIDRLIGEFEQSKGIPEVEYNLGTLRAIRAALKARAESLKQLNSTTKDLIASIGEIIKTDPWKGAPPHVQERMAISRKRLTLAEAQLRLQEERLRLSRDTFNFNSQIKVIGLALSIIRERLRALNMANQGKDAIEQVRVLTGLLNAYANLQQKGMFIDLPPGVSELLAGETSNILNRLKVLSDEVLSRGKYDATTKAIISQIVKQLDELDTILDTLGVPLVAPIPSIPAMQPPTQKPTTKPTQPKPQTPPQPQTPPKPPTGQQRRKQPPKYSDVVPF